jgi:hypothetical protein
VGKFGSKIKENGHPNLMTFLPNRDRNFKGTTHIIVELIEYEHNAVEQINNEKGN